MTVRRRRTTFDKCEKTWTELMLFLQLQLVVFMVEGGLSNPSPSSCNLRTTTGQRISQGHNEDFSLAALHTLDCFLRKREGDGGGRREILLD